MVKVKTTPKKRTQHHDRRRVDFARLAAMCGNGGISRAVVRESKGVYTCFRPYDHLTKQNLHQTTLVQFEDFKNLGDVRLDLYRCGRCGLNAEGGCCSQAPEFRRCFACKKFEAGWDLEEGALCPVCRKLVALRKA